MRHTMMNGLLATHRAAAALCTIAVLWTVAGIVAVIGPGGGLTRLSVALAVGMTEWWILSKVERRAEESGERWPPRPTFRA